MTIIYIPHQKKGNYTRVAGKRQVTLTPNFAKDGYGTPSRGSFQDTPQQQAASSFTLPGSQTASGAFLT